MTLAAVCAALLATALGADIHGGGHTASAQASRDWSFPVSVNDDRRSAEQATPSLAADASGTLHAVWSDGRQAGGGAEIYYSRLLVGATHWEPNRRVAGGAGAAHRVNPDVAVDGFGRVHVVWLEYVGAEPEIFHSMLAVGAALWTQPKRVNDDVGPGIQWSPVVAPDLLGNVHVAWVDYREGAPDVYHRRRGPEGVWSAGARVNDVAAGDQRDPALVLTPTGDLYAAWADTRGGVPGIYASRLPPSSDVWWPNAALTAGIEGELHRLPALAVDDGGTVHAAWISESDVSAIRVADLRQGRAFWAPSRIVHEPTRGAVMSVAVAGGPGGQVTMTWDESRPDGARIYSGTLPPGGRTDPARIDASHRVTDGRAPRVVIDQAPWAHVVWTGITEDGDRDVAYSRASLQRPDYPGAEVHGWLQYVPRRENCAQDGYVLVACDGSEGPFVTPLIGGVEALSGSYVTVRGDRVEGGLCPRVEALEVDLRSSPCPRSTGTVTGIVTVAGQPIEGVGLALDGQTAVSGTSGRFFLSGVEAGSHTLTATMGCALTASLADVTVPSGFQHVVPTGALVRADVVEDCSVDLHDLMRVANAYKTRPPFHPACADLDADGSVSIFDVSIVGANYGRSCPMRWDGSGGLTGGSSPPFAHQRPPDGTDGAVNVRSAAADAETPPQVDITLVGGSNVYGWEVAVAYPDGRTRPVDRDPVTPGVQPFAASELPPGSWVVANTASDGVARLAAVRLAPAAPLAGDAVIGALAFTAPVALAEVNLLAAVVAGDGVRAATGRFAVGAPERTDARKRLWLPRAGNGRSNTRVR